MLNEFIEEVMLNAEKNNAVENGDYIGEDGLLYCGKCHTKKQTYFNAPHTPLHNRKVFCTCKCKQEKLKERENAEIRAKEEFLLEQRKINAFGGADFQSCNFNNNKCYNEFLEMCGKKYVKNFQTEYKPQGKGLYIYGTTGSAKTYYAKCIANALIEKGENVFFTDLNYIISKCFDEGIERYKECSLLILDNFGTERHNVYNDEIIMTLIDSRYSALKPTLFLSNYSVDNIKEEKLLRRITEQCAVVNADFKKGVS